MTVSSQEDNDLPGESDLRARLIALMGGRAAEELLFHEVTPGASNDFEKATQIAQSMVNRWGMGRDPKVEADKAGASGRGTLSFFAAKREDQMVARRIDVMKRAASLERLPLAELTAMALPLVRVPAGR